MNNITINFSYHHNRRMWCLISFLSLSQAHYAIIVYNKNNNTNLFKKDSNLLDFLKQGPSHNDSDNFALGATDYGNHYMKNVNDMSSGLMNKLSDNLKPSQINTNSHLGFVKKDNKNDLLKT